MSDAYTWAKKTSGVESNMQRNRPSILLKGKLQRRNVLVLFYAGNWHRGRNSALS